jgi:hypothetical protein
VTRTEERVFDDPRKTSVNAPPLLAQIRVENRRQQRVREANRPVLALDYVRNSCLFERVCLNARPLEKRLRRGAQRSGERECVTSGRGECVDPLAH